MKKRTHIIFIAALTAYLTGAAQDIPIGQWRMHLAYKEGIAIAPGNGKIYCASKGGLFAYNLSDNSFERMSKLNGLSDQSVTAINFDFTTNTLIVAYKNSNIDIIQNGVITNLPDIKIKTIQGNKSINNIFFRAPYAYLSCGFGIVVIDLIKRETKDSYYIGLAGAPINVRDVNSDGTNLFAATDNGIYSASLNSSNLADFNSWTKQAGLPNGIFNTMTYFNGYIYANYSQNLASPSLWQQDKIYKYNGSWTLTNFDSDNYKRLRVCNNNLVCVGEYSLNVYDNTETKVGSNYHSYGFDNAWTADGFIDNNNAAWIADRKYGLVKAYPNGTAESLNPNGPKTNNVFAMAYGNGKIWSVPGGYELYNTDGVSMFSDNNWSTIGNLDTVPDIVCVAVDPNNPGHAFAGSWEHGLIEFNNGSGVNVYNPSNSSLHVQEAVSNYYVVRVGGIAYDDDGNLWMSNGQTNHILAVRKSNGTWQSMDFTGFVDKQKTGNVIVTKNSKQKWIQFPFNNLLVVYSDNNTFAAPNASNTKLITNTKGSGALPGNIVDCIAEDKDGAVWIGTDVGVAVFYSPDNIFNGGNWDAQQILVQQDGHTQILLQTEEVTAIKVDGANRKWFGTRRSGVFLMSSDGTKQIYHFDQTNSPLLSNEVDCITINDETGEVFFGTPNGILSFKSTATEGGEDFKDVYTYPNPVKHDYSGPIAIKGLVKNADVKITDITGTLIYQTKALGGQAIWDGKNFSGERAHTGVYMVFCTNDDGSKTFVTKILFIN